MPGHHPVVGLDGSLIDHGHLRQPPGPALIGATVPLAASPTGAQCDGHFPVQPTQLRSVDRLVDRLGHQMPPRLVGELAA